MTPRERYQIDLQKDGFIADPQQEKAVGFTQQLYHELIARDAYQPGLFDRLLKREPADIKGLYFWGGSGRGKTYLMDCFYECLPFQRKHRVHFHRFMLDIHEQLRSLPKSPNPLIIVANRIAEKVQVLCLDEFHVHDIADAMLMAGLLQALFDKGVTLVATSNIAIDDLYLNGLQRERFLHAIELLHQHTKEVELESGTDYRFSILEKSQCYYVATKEAGENIIAQQFDKLTPAPPKHNRAIEINSRNIRYKALADDVIWFDFNELCNTPRSANDYIQIAQSHHTVFISNIFHMSESHDNVAKRFVHLIDALYDHNVKLIAVAEAEPHHIYTGRRMAFAFERTVSRLSEMGSKNYLALPHLIEGMHRQQSCS